LRLVLRAKILENSSKGRVIPVVVCVEHERIVEVDEEWGLSFAKEERDVNHLQLLGHLVRVYRVSSWCHFAQRRVPHKPKDVLVDAECAHVIHLYELVVSIWVLGWEDWLQVQADGLVEEVCGDDGRGTGTAVPSMPETEEKGIRFRV